MFRSLITHYISWGGSASDNSELGLVYQSSHGCSPSVCDKRCILSCHMILAGRYATRLANH